MGSVIFITVSYALVCIGLIYTCFIADPKRSPASHFITKSLPKLIFRFIRSILGQKAVDVLQELSHHFLAIIYLVIVLGSWSIMFSYGYPFMTESTHVSNQHKWNGYAVFVLCMWSWQKTKSTSPGYITAQRIPKFDNYPYDDLLFIEIDCPTLGFRKLARSKYDRFTKRHVARFDHFCGWVDNSVGEENYRFFLLFLVIHVAMCCYGTFVIYHLFRGEIEDRGLYDAIFYNGVTGTERKADVWVVYHYMFMRYFPLASVFILLGAMSVVLTLFLSFHLYIAAFGMTTNEYYKWRHVKKWHKRATKKYEKALSDGTIVSKMAYNNKSTAGKDAGVDNDVDVGCTGPVTNNQASSKTPDETTTATATKPIVNPGPFPKNIYHLGIIENYKEILFPRSLRKDALERYEISRKERSLSSKEKCSKEVVTKTKDM